MVQLRENYQDIFDSSKRNTEQRNFTYCLKESFELEGSSLKDPMNERSRDLQGIAFTKWDSNTR